jgi:hypothetical protein
VKKAPLVRGANGLRLTAAPERQIASRLGLMSLCLRGLEAPVAA